MEQTWQNVWYVNGTTKVINTIIINGETVSISQQVQPYIQDDEGVTHGVLFGENIKRVYNTFFKK